MGQSAELIQEESLTQKFLTVEVHGQGYGLPIESVKEIVYHSKINPLPQTPPFIRGVTLIRDETMPVLDLNILLGKAEITEIHSESCFIVIQLSDKAGMLTQVCLLADRILQTYKIDRNEVDPVPQVNNQTVVNYVRGVARIDSNEIIIIIDPAGLISPYLEDMHSYDIYKESKHNKSRITANKQDTEAGKKSTQVNKYLSASVNGEEYAIPLNNVFQVLGKNDLEKFSDEDVPDFLASATIINNKAVGIVNLKDVLTKTNQESGNTKSDDNVMNKEVVVLVDFDESMLGIVVDKIGKTYETFHDLKKHSLCNDISRDRIQSLGFIDSDQGSIEVIQPSGVLIDSERHQVKAWMGAVERMMNMSERHSNAGNQSEDKSELNSFARYAGTYLLVGVGEHLVGIRNDDIDEVLTFDELIPLSNGPSWFMGLLDLRNTTYPVIDLHTRLDIQEKVEMDENRKVIVMVKNQDDKIALFVDQIVNSSHITAEQCQGTEASELYLNNGALLATANVDAGLVHIVSLKKVVSDEEISARKLLEELQDQNKS